MDAHGVFQESRDAKLRVLAGVLDGIADEIREQADAVRRAVGAERVTRTTLSEDWQRRWNSAIELESELNEMEDAGGEA